jgi:hypothetical protein
MSSYFLLTGNKISVGLGTPAFSGFNVFLKEINYVLLQRSTPLFGNDIAFVSEPFRYSDGSDYVFVFHITNGRIASIAYFYNTKFLPKKLLEIRYHFDTINAPLWNQMM